MGCLTAQLARLHHGDTPNQSICRPSCICKLPHPVHLHNSAQKPVDAGPLCSASAPGTAHWPLRMVFVVANVPVLLPPASDRLQVAWPGWSLGWSHHHLQLRNHSTAALQCQGQVTCVWAA